MPSIIKGKTTMQKVLIGKNKITKQPVYIDLENSVNNHGLVFGGSGVGKTYTIRGLARGFAAVSSRNRCIIFDVHGDILPKHKMVSSVTISEGSPVGLQPFKINPNPDYGGVNRTIKRFIYAINSTTTKLGVKQEAVLRRLLLDLFTIRGFYHDNPKTWSVDVDLRRNKRYAKAYPTFEDLLRFAKSKQEEAFMGANSDTVKAFHKLMGKSRKLKKERVKLDDSEELDLLKEELVAEFTDFVYDKLPHISENAIQDYLNYSSHDVLSSLINRLESLQSTGLFKNEPIEFDKSKPIHRYDLSTLSVSDQKIFINLALSDLYLELRERGFGGKTDTYVFIDESKNYIDKSEDNMIVRYFNEIRKYGCGLWLGAQSIDHFEDDIIRNAANKIILGVDSIYAASFAKRLNIDIKLIEGIKPKKSLLFESKQDGKKNDFVEVLIGQ